MNEGIRVHTWRDNGIEYDSSLQLPLAAIDEDPFAYVRAHFDIGVVASFGVKLPPTLINAFPHPPVNIHPSLLPAYRGAAPIQRALMRGEHTTGITLLTLHPTTFDAGRILYSEAVVCDLPRRHPLILCSRPRRVHIHVHSSAHILNELMILCYL
jgi:hypothetical protein